MLDLQPIANRLKEVLNHLKEQKVAKYGQKTIAEWIGIDQTGVSKMLNNGTNGEKLLHLAHIMHQKHDVDLNWVFAGNGEMFLTKSLEKPFESNESRTNPLTDEEGYKKLELQIAQIRRELISAQAEIAGNRKYIDQLDAYRESQLRNAKQDVMDVESGLEALNEKISQRNNRAEQGI